MTSILTTYTFVLKIKDKPGAMELIAAAFAQRGVSLSSSLGADATFDAEGYGAILITFSATPAKKEVLRRALQRLSRVHSLVEYSPDSPLLRKTALLRLDAAAPAPLLPLDVQGLVERVTDDRVPHTTTYLVTGPALAVDNILQLSHEAGTLRDAIQTTLAL